MLEKYYYLFLNLASFAVPFAFSFEKKWMHFIRFWKPYFFSIFWVGMFFILWDIYFTVNEVWGFNDQYLIGVRWFSMPVEEWMFFLLIPFASNFIHYSLEYFFPKFLLSQSAVNFITMALLIIGLGVTVTNLDKIYTLVNFGVFSTLMLLQLIFKWSYARRFYISFILIYIPFFFVNSALTGSYSENPVVFYDNAENLGLRIGTMPVEDSFYCFSMLYMSVLLFEFLRRKWNYCLSLKYIDCKNEN